MSATDDRTQDPAVSHPAENMGHEMSDFSWTTVLWLLPFSVVVLVVFTVVSLYWFRGAKDRQISVKQGVEANQQLRLLRAKEDEALNQYKWLDKDKGRAQIPIARAMDLVVEEHKGTAGMDYRPITDIYLEANPGMSLASRMTESAAAPETPAAHQPENPATPGKAQPGEKAPAPAGAEHKHK